MRHSQGFLSRVLHLFPTVKTIDSIQDSLTLPLCSCALRALSLSPSLSAAVWPPRHCSFARYLFARSILQRATQGTHISQFHSYGVFTFSHVLRAAPHQAYFTSGAANTTMQPEECFALEFRAAARINCTPNVCVRCPRDYNAQADTAVAVVVTV